MPPGPAHQRYLQAQPGAEFPGDFRPARRLGARPRRKFPQLFPRAPFGPLHQQHPILVPEHKHPPVHRCRLGLCTFYRKDVLGSMSKCPADAADRAQWALGVPRPADRGAQFHQRLVVIPGRRRRHVPGRQFPKIALGLC